MEYRYIGKTGLRVTPICLGTMTFGSQADKKESFKIMDKAYEKGINIFDTAELYPVPPSAHYAGLTEEIVGEWLQGKERDSIILASKVAGAVILEPIMKLEVLTPEENMGDIVGDLNRRRGQVNDMSDRAGAKVVKAQVPLSEMFGYVTTLRTLSSGRATSTMEFSHYAATPSSISEEVIAAARGTNV